MSDEIEGRSEAHAGSALTPFAAPEIPAPSTGVPIPPLAPAPTGDDWTIPVSVGVMQLAGLGAIGAGAIHAAAIGMHSETPTLARLFVAVAVAQLATGLLALVKGGRLAAVLTILANGVAVGAWAATRLWDIDWVTGLEQSERPEFTDTACAALGTVAVLAAAAALVFGRTAVSKVRLGVPGLSVGTVAVVAMLVGANHVHTEGAGHSHAAGTEATAEGAAAVESADGHSHDGTEAATGEEAAVESADEGHAHTDEAAGVQPAVDLAETDGAAADPTAWPRAWDPAEGVDLSGVPGVTRDQELRAAGLINRTLEDLPRFADVNSVGALGFESIGDASTGYEHFINYSYIGDDKLLDPTAPESLVYRVDGEERTLVSAMFIASNMPVDDPSLVEIGGPLMQWHVHENLCWVSDSEGLRVAGVTDDAGNCPAGTFNAGGNNPMVHVWIVPHECGPFAALEGHGAGQVGNGTTTRVDQCSHEHGGGGDEAAAHEHPAEEAPAEDAASENVVTADGGETPTADASTEWNPTQPINLSGMPGVTSEQQAFAENLVASNLVDLPQWSDPEVAEAAGFRSIGDGATGHEHFINWDWINDDVFLDPDFPESLVYEPQPDGTRKLVSAMYMMPDSYEIADVPDWGGALMQWHIHDNLCFDTSGEAPRVGGLTDADGACTAPLVKLGQSPMIHVWLTPNPCGPFAALEGVGAGQVAEGETHLCDHAHGSG